MSAANNVVRLPTAARRQPPNHRYAAQASAARAMRLAQPWPGKIRTPMERLESRGDDWIEAPRRTPELLMAMALFKALTPAQRKAARVTIDATAAIFGDDDARVAAAILAKLA